MTPAIALAAVVTFSLLLGSLIMQVDGAKLRRWRLARRWDVSRLASEFIAAADEPLATLRGLKHMINAWERGDRRPSERYWLLYLRVFPECANGETASADQREPADQPADPQDIRALAATVKALEQRIAGLSRRMDELSRDERDERDERQPRDRNVRRKTRPRYRPATWSPLYL
jgi:uncharacterized protein YceH (UPF0502 family)